MASNCIIQHIRKLDIYTFHNTLKWIQRSHTHQWMRWGLTLDTSNNHSIKSSVPSHSGSPEEIKQVVYVTNKCDKFFVNKGASQPWNDNRLNKRFCLTDAALIKLSNHLVTDDIANQDVSSTSADTSPTPQPVDSAQHHTPAVVDKALRGK